MEGVEYPVKLRDIKRFEKQNPDLSVSVFGYEEERIFPLHVTEDVKATHVNPLYYTH